MRVLSGLRRLPTMRRLRRLCFAAAALILLLAAVAPRFAKAEDPDDGRPVVWAGQADASGIHAQADSTSGILPVKDPFFATTPDASATWDTLRANSRASTYYPGPTALGGVSLICERVLTMIFNPSAIPVPFNTFDPLCNPPPQFPLVAIADFNKGKPDARIDGSQALGTGLPLTLTATSGIAHADRTSVSGDAVIGGVNLVGTPATSASALTFRKQAAGILGGPLAAAKVTATAADNSTLHVDGSVAHTSQVFDKDGALLVKAQATLSGVHLAGDAIKIESISSESTSRTDGKGIAEHEEHVTLAGVTVAGQPASIDEQGVHVLGPANSAKPLTDAVNAALKSMGASLTLATAQGDVKGGDGVKTVSSNGEGLIFHIEQTVNVPNLVATYFATFTLGVVGTTATSSADRAGAPAVEEGGIGGLSTPSGSPDVPGTPGEPAATFDIPGTPASAGTVGGSTSRGGTTSVLGARRAGVLDQLEAELSNRRLDLVYIGFTLAFVGVCLSSRLLVPRARRVS